MLRLVGVDPDQARHYRGDTAFYTALVVLSALVATLGFVGMFSMLKMTGQTTLISAAGGALWAAIILTIDLLIAQPSVEGVMSRVVKGIARLFLASAVGIVVSAFLLATLFKTDVDRDALKDFNSELATAAQESTQTLDAAGEAWDARREAFIADLDGAEIAAVKDSLKLQQATLAERTAEAGAAHIRCIKEPLGEGETGKPGVGFATARECGRADDLVKAKVDLELAVAELEATHQALLAERSTRIDQWDQANPDPRTPGDSPEPIAFDPVDLGIWERIERTHKLLGWTGTVFATLMLVAVDSLVVIMKMLRGNTMYAQAAHDADGRALERSGSRARRKVEWAIWTAQTDAETTARKHEAEADLDRYLTASKRAQAPAVRYLRLAMVAVSLSVTMTASYNYWTSRSETSSASASTVSDGGFVSGLVVSDQGDPLVADVTIQFVESGSISDTVSTADGSFEFKELPLDGNFWVMATTDNGSGLTSGYLTGVEPKRDDLQVVMGDAVDSQGLDSAPQFPPGAEIIFPGSESVGQIDGEDFTSEGDFADEPDVEDE